MPAEMLKKYYPENNNPTNDTRMQRFLSKILGFYYYGYHRLEVDIHPDTPRYGPALALMGHHSLLDGAAIVADPYRPRTIGVAKEEMTNAPLVGWALRQWETIPVARDGQDIKAVSRILAAFKEGRIVGLAPEGTRNREGRIGPLNPTAIELALWASSKNIPVFPVGVIGSYEALPPGSWLPKPKKLIFRTGPTIDLSPFRSAPRHEALPEAALIIRSAIANLYPEQNQPLPETPPLLDR